MKIAELPDSVVRRRAIVYVRQSTMTQVRENLESQRRQYDLVEIARSYGFTDVVTIDDDLGRSASGLVARPGFNALVAQMCQGIIGAVFCLEASRLARNGREWHHLLEMCGLVGARVIDVDGAYDPSHPNDRLLLGLKGTMSEFELTLIRRRLVDGALAKARRGEFRVRVPIGYLWSRDTGLEMNPDQRIQDALRTVFRLFARFQSARATHLHMVKERILFPRPAEARGRGALRWLSPTFRNVISLLQNPFHAGAYAYGKTTHKTELVEGRLSKSYGHDRPMASWTVLLRDHHAAFITWEDFERNQEQLRKNAHRSAAGRPKSGRGGRALLSGLLRCRRCGRMLGVLYSGNGRRARYECNSAHKANGLPRCVAFGAAKPDDAVASELLRVVEPLAVEAAMKAMDLAKRHADDRARAFELERQQAEYDVQLAQRRYESVDPNNRLVASELEARWNAALARLRETEKRIEAAPPPTPDVKQEELLRLASDLKAAWHSPTTEPSVKQRLVRSLVEEIVVDVDKDAREIILVIHWRGGRHSELRARKPGPGEHGQSAPSAAVHVIREMAGAWSDEHIAATLNRMNLKTGQGNSWTWRRVQSLRRTADIPARAAAHDKRRWITLRDAAASLGVAQHAVRRLIKAGVLPAKQVVTDAPWQILVEDLQLPAVQEALRAQPRPSRARGDDRTLTIPGT